jgi:hypothetical protein
MWRLGSLLFPLTICAAFCQPRELPLPASVLEVKWERSFLLTIEADKVVVRDRQGSILLSARPAPEGVAIRKLEVRDVAVMGERDFAASVYASKSLGQRANLIVFFDLDRPGQPSGYLDTGSVACERIAAAGAERFWCLGSDVARKAQGLDHPVVSIFDRRGAATADFLPRSRLPEPEGTAVLLPTGPEKSVVWLPNARFLAELDAKTRAANRLQIPANANGRSMISLARLPDGRLAGLFPRRPADSEESLATPYELRVRNAATGQWQVVPGFEARPRGTALIGAGPGGLVLWNRPARLVEWVRLPD